MRPAHDASNSIMNKRHAYAANPDAKHDSDPAFTYQELEGEYEHVEYPKHVYSMDEEGKSVLSLSVADPEAEKALKGKWYDSPNKAIAAYKASKLAKA